MASGSEMMKAIAIKDGRGPASALHAVDIPRPVPKEGQILIRVKAAGINKPDILQREGLFECSIGIETCD